MPHAWPSGAHAVCSTWGHISLSPDISYWLSLKRLLVIASNSTTTIFIRSTPCGHSRRTTNQVRPSATQGRPCCAPVPQENATSHLMTATEAQQDARDLLCCLCRERRGPPPTAQQGSTQCGCCPRRFHRRSTTTCSTSCAAACRAGPSRRCRCPPRRCRCRMRCASGTVAPSSRGTSTPTRATHTPTRRYKTR